MSTTHAQGARSAHVTQGARSAHATQGQGQETLARIVREQHATREAYDTASAASVAVNVAASAAVNAARAVHDALSEPRQRSQVARRVPRQFFIQHRGSEAAGHPASDFATLICTDCDRLYLVRISSKIVPSGLENIARRIAGAINASVSEEKRDELWSQL